MTDNNGNEIDPGKRLIGLLLVDPASVLEAAVACGMKVSWLSHEWQREAYTCAREMDGKGLPIDEHFLYDYAKANGYTIKPEELKDAIHCAPSRRNSVDGLFDSLRREFVRSEVLRVGDTLSHGTGDPVEMASEAAQELMDVAISHSGAETKESVCSEIKQDWTNAMSGIKTGLPMPWSRVFNRCGSVDKGQVCLIVGHGASGKSSLTLQWALHLAKMGIPTLSFPIEDGIKVAYKRLAGMHGEFNPLNLRLANELVTDTFVENAKRSLDEVAGMPMYLSGLRGTVADIAVEAQHAVANKGVKAVFVDAFKDIATRSDGVEGDNATIAGLCAMARRLNIQVVVTHHVRKNPSSMKGVDPRRAWTIEPSDLRGSGRLWDDARMVIALQMWPNGSIVNEREQFDYNLHLMKVNHGYAGFYFPVIRSVGGTWDEIQNI